MDEQPIELREYLVEAEALATEWYSREGLEPSHETNIELLATLLCLTLVISSEQTFEALRDAAKIYLIAAFQMGRAAYDNNTCCTE